MRRREFITLLGSAAACWPLAAHAQQPTMPVVGILSSASLYAFTDLLGPFRQGLKEAGYIEGQNVAIELRWAEGHFERLPNLTTELVQRRPAVIVTTGGSSTLAVRAASSTVPHVFLSQDDPVKLGLVVSFNHPGGNATGMSLLTSALVAKRLEFDLLFRWFVGIGVDDAAWDHSVFSKNRERLLEGDIAAKLLSAVLAHPRVRRLLSTDHFSVDGTLIEAWASMKSFKPKDGSDEPPADGDGRNREVDFHGEKRSNDTHASTTDPEARLYRKGPGKEAKLCFMGHALMENRNGLVVDACLTPADGHAERVAALHMIEPHADRPQAITLGADKAYDAEDFVNELRSMKVTPHVAQNTSGRSSAIDGRTTRHAGYAVSQRIRKRIEEAFGWIKMVAGLEQTKFRGCDRVGWAFSFAATAYNLTRLPKLLASSA